MIVNYLTFKMFFTKAVRKIPTYFSMKVSRCHQIINLIIFYKYQDFFHQSENN